MTLSGGTLLLIGIKASSFCDKWRVPNFVWNEPTSMPKPTRSPAELRNMLGDNLHVLALNYPSISELSRRLGINRTQFNRYLSGESFPRPDVLDKICSFFEVDARILLEPVANLQTKSSILNSPFLNEFLGTGVHRVSENVFPSGFYRFTRRSFVDDTRFVVGIVYVFRDGSVTYIKGFEPRVGMSYQGLPMDGRSREFRGYMTCLDDGVAFVLGRRRSYAHSFNYLARVSSAENGLWIGYVTRSVRESESGDRARRMLYEYLGPNIRDALPAARKSGFLETPAIMPYHRRLLRLGERFS